MEAPKNISINPDCILLTRLCEIFEFDGWAIVIMLWTSFAGFLTFFLLVSHIYMIATNMTTNEMSNFWRYDYLVRDGDMTKPSYNRDFFNPFDYGPLDNIYTFWNESKNIWIDMMEVPERRQKSLWVKDKEYSIV